MAWGTLGRLRLPSDFAQVSTPRHQTDWIASSCNQEMCSGINNTLPPWRAVSNSLGCWLLQHLGEFWPSDQGGQISGLAEPYGTSPGSLESFYYIQYGCEGPDAIRAAGAAWQPTVCWAVQAGGKSQAARLDLSDGCELAHVPGLKRKDF